MKDNCFATKRIVGVDEAGAGCLFGPVSAGAVILGDNFPNDILSRLTDSKKISKKKREILFEEICQHGTWACGLVWPEEIDQINILQARIKAMHLALDQINSDKYDMILVDGNRFKNYKEKPHMTIIKGDLTEKAISAASIVAKVTRDRLITKLVDECPILRKFQIEKNMGYPTKVHRDAVEEYGITNLHRKTFGLNKGKTVKFNLIFNE